MFTGFLVESGLFSTPSIVVKNQFLPLWNHRRDKGKEEEIKEKRGIKENRKKEEE
ncbi:MAG: hypothetical protein ACI4YB_08825 [Oscillospiraceae bacterium]